MQVLPVRTRSSIISHCALVWLLTLTTPAYASLINITDGIAYSIALDGSVSSAPTQQTQSFTTPFSHTATVGGSSSTTSFDNVDAGTSQTLSWDFTHQQAGKAIGDSARSRASGPDFTFVASEDLDYALSGTYQLTGSGRIRLIVGLKDQTAGSLDLFTNVQEIVFGTDSLLTLGNPGIVLVGTPIGSLTKGHTYELSYNWSISEQQDGSGPIGTVGASTSAMGGFQLALTLSDSGTVPEPTTLALMCLGLVGIGYKRHRSKIAT